MRSAQLLYCIIISKGYCVRKEEGFDAFPLKNFGNESAYAEISVEECQLLCQMTKGCLYFGYNNIRTECYLKYGMGIGHSLTFFNIGPKFCPG